jgi:hypothetical protein
LLQLHRQIFKTGSLLVSYDAPALCQLTPGAWVKILLRADTFLGGVDAINQPLTQ